jgi:GH25 family lysozyme M1 (1,4-beta-N-acetylmuramidase)
MATDDKVVGVIHRSTDGLRVDSKYQRRSDIAASRGYLWGAYHLGRPGNVIQQADLFLDTIGHDPDTLMVLDIESTSSSSMMGVDDAVIFMKYIFEKTGRIPVVYANHTVTKTLNARLARNKLFKKSKLWYARFRSSIPNFPTGIWKKYFLWQFSSEINCSRSGRCLYNVPGTHSNMDINVFNGTKDELTAQWTYSD